MAKRRKCGEGSIRLRGDGRWEGRVVVGYNDKGYAKTKSVFAKSKKECVDKLKVLREQYSGLKSEKVKEDMPFGSWIEFWYYNYCKPRVGASTQVTHENTIFNHIIPEIGEIPLNKLTQNDLQQYYTRLKTSGRIRLTDLYGEGLSDRAVRMSHANCRAALEKAKEEGLIRSNPAVGCKLPPKKAREMQVLTREEIQRFLIQAKYEGYYELFLLELSTGMRRGELLALHWSDLNFKTNELRINKQVTRVRGELIVSKPKTKASTRTIILPQALMSILKEYKRESNSRWMFPSPVKEDSPRDPGAVRIKMAQILERSGCKHIRFHDLRHTFATRALENGMDVKTLSTVIGHVSSETTLNIYTHITEEMLQAAASSIERGLGKNMTAEVEQEKRPKPTMTDFKPYTGKIRKAGTGCISQINDHLFEGRYSPMWVDGKKHGFNVYAKTREEVEIKLAELIVEVKAEKERLIAEKAAEAKKSEGKMDKGKKHK